MRWLLILFVVAAGLWLLRRALRNAASSAEAGPPQTQARGQGDLVRCAHCGTHLPLAEARAVGDRVYCSDEHARLGPGGS